MNSGHTAERVYDAVKRRILTGAYRPGERIEVAALAQQVDSSATPVRDALHLLVGERLIETRSGDGFHLPQIDAPALNDLYEWSAQVLLQALRSWKADHGPDAQSTGNQTDADPGEVAGGLFARVGALASNAEYRREIQSINDRLYAARIAEAAVLLDWRDEIAILQVELERGNVPVLRRLIVAYHRRRKRAVMETIRAFHHLGSSI
jgi:DNA-binding GntR family transcriptional regulator